MLFLELIHPRMCRVVENLMYTASLLEWGIDSLCLETPAIVAAAHLQKKTKKEYSTVLVIR